MTENNIQADPSRPVFYIEVSPAADSPLRGADDFVLATAEKVREVSSTIASVCGDVMSALREGVSAVSPDELELTFGVSLGGESSVVVAKATSEATFTVRALWTKTPS